MNKTLERFKKFEIKDQTLIKAGAIWVTWVGGGEGESLFDAYDDETGDHYCSVEDFDLTFNIGDQIG